MSNWRRLWNVQIYSTFLSSLVGDARAHCLLLSFKDTVSVVGNDGRYMRRASDGNTRQQTLRPALSSIERGLLRLHFRVRKVASFDGVLEDEVGHRNVSASSARCSKLAV